MFNVLGVLLRKKELLLVGKICTTLPLIVLIVFPISTGKNKVLIAAINE